MVSPSGCTEGGCPGFCANAEEVEALSENLNFSPGGRERLVYIQKEREVGDGKIIEFPDLGNPEQSGRAQP